MSRLAITSSQLQTLFFSSQDMVRIVRELGVPVSIPPTFANPKDLFGQLGLRAMETRAALALEH